MRPGGPEALIGMTLSGRYKIERLLGEGGMGAVYQAEHTHMRKRLAIKVLHAEMSRLPEVVARFEREAMAAANIDHPNVAKATDFGKLDDGSFFLALEYVEGHSLRDEIGRGRLELGRALHILSQCAGALGRAHQLGIVHRDLKPENVMLVERDGDADFVKVLDFGIAKVPVGELGSGKDSGGGGAGHPVLTQLGMVYGTPEYMAPEQALGQEVDARADLYALGIIAYEMLTSERPFDHESKVALLGMHVTAPVPPFSERAPDARIPRDVEAIVTKLLAKEASHRYVDARELFDAVSAIEAQLVAHGIIQGPPAVMSPMSGPLSGAMGGPRGTQASAPKLLNADASAPYPSLDDAGAHDAFRPPAVPRIGSTSRTNKRILIGGGAALALVVLVGIGVVIGVTASARGGGDSSASSASASGSSVSTASASIAPDSPIQQLSIDAEITAARANVDKGNFASAIDALSPLAQRFPRRADVHQLLEKAYSGAKNPGAAMHEAEAWIDVDPAAIEDLKLLEDIRNASLTARDGTDTAFMLLEEKLGAAGTDILYDIAYLTSGQLYPAAATRAKASLAKPAVRAIGSRALLVLLEFRDAKTCDAKRALLDRAKDEGDWRIVPMLKLYLPTSGCGFLRRHDCFPCMHRDRALNDAIATIDARSKKGP